MSMLEPESDKHEIFRQPTVATVAYNYVDHWHCSLSGCYHIGNEIVNFYMYRMLENHNTNQDNQSVRQASLATPAENRLSSSSN